MKPQQMDLFANARPSRPSRVSGAAQRAEARQACSVEFFDFVLDGDAAACVPRPGWVVPVEIRLGILDEK